jgi:hypothetical protein
MEPKEGAMEFHVLAGSSCSLYSSRRMTILLDLDGTSSIGIGGDSPRFGLDELDGIGGVSCLPSPIPAVHLHAGDTLKLQQI